MKRILCIALIVMLPVGCAPRDRSNKTKTVIRAAEHGRILTIAMDLTGSCRDKMAQSGHAFAMHAISKYFQSSIGTSDQLIIAALSGTRRSLIWQGTPASLRREFPSADAFRDFLLSKADPNGSLIHDGLRNVVDYLATDPQLASGHAKSVLLCLSDMEDNGPDPAGSEQKLVDSLRGLARTDTVIGLYFVEQGRIPTWRRNLQSAGFREIEVQPEFVGMPPLPNLD